MLKQFVFIQTDSWSRASTAALDVRAASLIVMDGNAVLIVSQQLPLRCRISLLAGSAQVAGFMKYPWPLARVFLFVPVPVRDAVYDHVAHHRYKWFGKTSQCQVGVATLLL